MKELKNSFLENICEELLLKDQFSGIYGQLHGLFLYDRDLRHERIKEQFFREHIWAAASEKSIFRDLWATVMNWIVFRRMVDKRNAINLISSQDNCQRFLLSQIFDTRAGFEPAQNLWVHPLSSKINLSVNLSVICNLFVIFLNNVIFRKIFDYKIAPISYFGLT